jgi:hypothetical protein
MPTRKWHDPLPPRRRVARAQASVLLGATDTSLASPEAVLDPEAAPPPEDDVDDGDGGGDEPPESSVGETLGAPELPP